ncbi:MFS family permease [Granulicella aggregans]|uniref:MFS family permease n=1 Tax=Granulicella aggregans TaxID=474949 RepID=A0A7W7ZGH5_9BACT|nr:MFS transporter [Granulicella aggregans]MBB5059412.1 MFS family permease [Granulicella aggregans]
MPTHPPTSIANESSLSYTGWRVTMAAFVGVMVSFAAIVPYTFSLFLSPLQLAFGWKREAISRGFALAALTVAACSPFLGSLLDRLPPRRIILPCIAIFAVGIASLSLLKGHIGQFYATYVVLGVVGNGTAQLAYSRAVLTWFDRRRGLALAVVLAGSGTGSILLPMLAQHVIGAYGWHDAYLVLGVVALLGLPLTAWLVRNNPAAEAVATESASLTTISGVLKTSTFWLIAIPVLLSALSLNGTIAHLAALLTGRSVTPASAALALSMLGLSGIVGRLITGHLLDRVFAPMVSLTVLLIAAAGIVTVAYATSAPMGILGAFLIGFGAGSEADVVPYLIAKYFGRSRFSTLYGLSWTAYAVGAAFGPVLMGRAFDRAGSYVPSTVLLLSAPLFVAAFLQLLLPRYAEDSRASSSVLLTGAATDLSM